MTTTILQQTDIAYKAGDVDVCLEHVADVVCTNVVDTVSFQSKCLHPVVVLNNNGVTNIT